MYATCFAVLSHAVKLLLNFFLHRFILQEMGIEFLFVVWLHVEDKLDINSCYMMLEIHTCYFQGSLFYVCDLCSS